ncbi:hypothetical protein NMQ14_13425 [Methyloversatilis sp. XJ19-13]|uniref:PEP-CTERM sorting domain-containing protein n=1 Tax=Methyloversatilis sp. XJ19-13 TaxID=2963430 RepID=UPI00211B76F9|nr:PEP-CTERM sorting domain-containing protein [Methyloversatilis sp. XJ19-13]MCQ9375253.1 hypothetical protein [Methyloversatilis sp. XJ19-13]
MKIFVFSVVSALMVASWAVQAAPNYKLTLIDGMNEGKAINNSGDIIGLGSLNYGIYSGIGSSALHFSLGGGLKTLGVQVYEPIDNASNYFSVHDINDQGNALVTYSGYYNGSGDIEGYAFAYSFIQNVRTDEFVLNVGGSAINNMNNVVGYRYISGPDIGLIGLRDNFTAPQEDTIHAYVINDQNTVGGYITVDSNGHPVSTTSPEPIRAPAIWISPSAPTYLNRGGYRDGLVSAINNAGLVVGGVGEHIFFEPDGRAASWNGGVLSLLPNGDFDGSFANSVNSGGAIVGIAENFASNEAAAVLWLDDELIDLNQYLSAELKNAGWSLETANDINDSGWIVGRAASSQTGEERAFLLSISAVPEPASWTFVVAGLGLISVIRRIRHS